MLIHVPHVLQFQIDFFLSGVGPGPVEWIWMRFCPRLLRFERFLIVLVRLILILIILHISRSVFLLFTIQAVFQRAALALVVADGITRELMYRDAPNGEGSLTSQ